MSAANAILLVDDSEDDIFFMREAFQSAKVTNPVFIAEDGQKAIDYLSGVGQFGDRVTFPLPVLIFLDLKMPGRGGLEVLAWLRQQEALRKIVVLVLTSSQEPSDLSQAYRLGANSYLVKPSTLDQLRELVRAVKSYWLDFNLFGSA